MNEKTYRFHFYQNRKIYFGISIVLLVVGILASVIIGPHLDIQFAGGSMILYSVEGGQADASGVEAAVSESTGRNCEVAISQDITTGGEQVTVSFSGNQAMTPEEQAAVTSALQSAYPDLGFELLSSSCPGVRWHHGGVTWGLHCPARPQDWRPGRGHYRCNRADARCAHRFLRVCGLRAGH